MSDWRNSTNQSCAQERISDISTYITATSMVPKSPIDVFYKSIREILVTAVPTFFTQHPSIGPLLLVGIVSATENYFRDVLSRVIQICPIAQSSSAAKSINLGSVIWHSGVNLERGTFEHISLAGAESIITTCKQYLKFDIDNTGLTFAILEEYDKVCELRHSIVHSGAIIAGKNAIKLGISPCCDIITIKIGFDQLQECASICSTLVVSFNTDIFEALCKRWAVDWRRRSSWNPGKQNEIFHKLWKICFSEIDNSNGAIMERLSMVKCRNKVKQEFGLII
ncbi:MAG: hypothetical protein P4N59_29415 [Negativicutes bacterium]|nr:hypothetical protein [Negativicutes bacterium]